MVTAGNLKKIFLGLIILLLSSEIKGAYAFSINPGRAEIVIEPNGKLVTEFSITNPDADSIRVKIFADKWVTKAGNDATSWIKIVPKEVEIPANSSKNVKLEITAPGDVEGEYTSSLVFKSAKLTNGEMEGIGELVTQVRLVTYVVIKGTEKVDCEISNIEVLSTEPLKISVKVKNSGNIHVRPKGKVEIVKMTNTGAEIKEDKIANLDLNPIEGPIFPDGEGEIGPKSDDLKLVPGNYKIKVSAVLSPEIVLNKEIEFTVPEKKAQ